MRFTAVVCLFLASQLMLSSAFHMAGIYFKNYHVQGLIGLGALLGAGYGTLALGALAGKAANHHGHYITHVVDPVGVYGHGYGALGFPAVHGGYLGTGLHGGHILRRRR